MIKRYFLLYLLVFAIPVFLGLLVWQSNRYQSLNGELLLLEKTQEEWVESNKGLIASIAEYSSAQRIDEEARYHLSLQKIRPEHLLQVKIAEGGGNGR